MELKIYPDEVLRQSCEVLREVGDEEARRMRQMLELMYETHGVGLAGPQVGWSVRVLTLDVDQERADPRIFLNPRLLESEGEVLEEEGCLSLPGLTAQVPRAERVRVVAYTMQGERHEEEAEGLRARAWQHEIDHLDGVLFVDRLSPTVRLGLRHQLKELENRRAEQPAETV